MPDLLINIIRSFHEAKVRINGKLLEEIDVENGLRHGCAMAPVLFNLYAGLVFEQWTSRAAGLEGVGNILLHSFDQKLFRKSTRNACESKLIDDPFADDAVLLATTRAGAEQAMRLYCDVAKAFGLTVNIQKIKLTGFNTKEEEKVPMCVGDSMIEYFGSVVTPNARMDAEVDRHIASASKAFGTLHKAVFKDRNLNITTKRQVYQACVLSVLLYRSECWMPLCRHLKRLNVFHHRCIHTVLAITSRKQWEQHITSHMTRDLWGDAETVAAKVVKCRLEWLGHVAWMPEHRIPKKALFGCLSQARPPGRPQRKWRDLGSEGCRGPRAEVV